ncbi:MAG: J domain-containing protein [Candidatus Sericytochromatia bacterium]
MNRRSQAVLDALLAERPQLDPAWVQRLESLARLLGRRCEPAELRLRLHRLLDSPELELLANTELDTGWMSARVRKRYQAEVLRLLEMPVGAREDYLQAHESWKGPLGLFYDTPESRQAFSLLGLEPPSTPDQIRQAYRRQARSLHPDLGGGSEAFIHLQRAYRLALESCL